MNRWPELTLTRRGGLPFNRVELLLLHRTWSLVPPVTKFTRGTKLRCDSKCAYVAVTHDGVDPERS